MKRIFLLTSFIFFASIPSIAQSIEKKASDADKYFKIRNYKQAIPLYLEVIESGIKDPIIYYRTGASYERSVEIDDKVKAIPYLEKAIALGLDQLPPMVYFELAEVYHKDGQIEKAMTNYEKYKATVKNNPKKLKEVNRALEVATNALSFMGSPKNARIVNLGTAVNTESTEYNPVVSADESVLAFTALRPNTGKTRSNEKFIEEINISYNKSGSWIEPKRIDIQSSYNVGTAGLSADGQHMLIFIGGANNAGNLYTIDKSGDDWSIPVSMGRSINSNFLETTASITPDGKTLYFASDRNGGYGGLDIYKSMKLESGDWGNPVNLGPKVNSKYDEDAPFIHPDQWTLFFTSNGHNTMGGRDIFVSRLFNEEWTVPENMGYPINTTADDDYFTLTADGRRGYFSSDRKGGQGGQDIYALDMPEEETNIPLTMIKGKIIDGETGKTLPTRIYMIDNASGKKLDYVYQPDPVTGKYLVILPPAKNYDMIIESEGFLPYTLNINIPGQTYFYEMYQNIVLRTIKQFDVTVGQSVEVNNAFFDTHDEAVQNLRESHESVLIKNDSIDAYDLMSDLISANDQSGIDYLIGLLQDNNSIDDIDFSKGEKMESATRVYYYDESDESKFEKKVIDDKTIFSLPTMYVTEEAERQKNMKKEKPKYDRALLNEIVKIYFEVGKSDLQENYNGAINKVYTILKSNPQLGVQISGYASSEGEAEYNRKLSNKRAITVLDYINQKGIVRRRIVARGYGETKDEKSTAKEGRRVEMRIIDLQNNLK